MVGASVSGALGEVVGIVVVVGDGVIGAVVTGAGAAVVAAMVVVVVVGAGVNGAFRVVVVDVVGFTAVVCTEGKTCKLTIITTNQLHISNDILEQY